MAVASRITQLTGYEDRFVGGLMIEIAYGDTATSADDELITLADAVVRETMDSSGSLVGTLVDFFPARKC